jgi:hypothetical protein
VTLCAAFVDTSLTLLLADTDNIRCKLVTVDAASMVVVRWSALIEGGSYGIAVLPAQGVVVVSDWGHDKLHVYRLQTASVSQAPTLWAPRMLLPTQPPGLYSLAQERSLG